MTKQNIWLIVILIVVFVGMTVFAIVDSRNVLSKVNESIKKMNTEFNSVSVKYAFVNPKPTPTIDLHKSQLRALYRMQVVAMEYEAMADQDTLTLEQKVDVLSMEVANILRYNFTGYHKYYPEPPWDEWLREIREDADAGINEKVK